MDLKTISQNATLVELGMDSISGNEITQMLENDFDIVLTAKSLRTLTFNQLSEMELKNEGATVVTDEKPGFWDVIEFRPYQNREDQSVISLTKQIDNIVRGPQLFLLPGINNILIPLGNLVQDLGLDTWRVLYKYTKSEQTIFEMASNILPVRTDQPNINNELSLII